MIVSFLAVFRTLSQIRMLYSIIWENKWVGVLVISQRFFEW